MKYSWSHIKYVVLLTLAFAAGVVAENTIHIIPRNVHGRTQPFYEVRLEGYKYIRPLLRCENEDTRNIERVEEPKKKLTRLTDDQMKAGMASHISVYFRYPTNVNWFVIGQDEKYVPASLMKVPVMMMLYRNSANSPEFLEKKLIFDREPSVENASYKPSRTLEKGKEYTINELIERMIVYSDNDAKNLLLSSINLLEYNKVFTDISLPTVGIYDSSDFMTVETYARFFRTLYNASFLNKRLSEQSMDYLARTEFKKGLMAGLPPDVVAAHKFGEAVDLVSQEKQLHDCGYIYPGENPYLLCVMTKGTSFKDLEYVIQSISALTYKEMEHIQEES